MITISDLTKYIDSQELINLTDDENEGEVNLDRLNQAIASATSEVVSYTQGKYLIPSPPSDFIQQILADITIYLLYKRRMRLDMPESIKQIYENAVNKLKSIQRGEVIPVGLTAFDNAGFIKTNKTDKDKIFGKEALDGY